MFAFSCFAELDPSLAAAVAAYWEQQAALGMGPAHVRMAGDVWDILREPGGRLRWLHDHIPRGALTLLVAGSPCQDLTSAGAHEGRVGLCGERSVLFYVIPALAWALARSRPDLHIHVVAENAGSVRQEHLQAMGEALGIGNLAAHAQRLDAGDWTSMPRRRIFLSTLPPASVCRPAGRRPPPWDRGWGLAPGGAAPAMLRARGGPGEPLQASTYQYAPGMLLYQRGS